MRLIITFVLTFVLFQSFSQKRTTPDEYIQLYSDIAVKEMIKYGVPASITLAQGIHESDCGNSYLAREGNNHFGIKCHTSWTGEKLYRDDDEKNECFRKYASAEESFRDHSEFLRKYSRYSFLFDLNVTDYKAWAEGLKTAGYATNPKYASLIIETVEKYKLDIYDKGVTPDKYIKDNNDKEENVITEISLIKKKPEILINNRTKYIIVKKGDSFFKLSEQLGLTIRYLHKCNDLQIDDPLVEGKVLYIEKKRSWAEREKKFHVVKKGETLYSISQLYAVKLKRLFKRNRLKYGEAVQPGDTVWLRKWKPVKKIED